MIVHANRRRTFYSPGLFALYVLSVVSSALLGCAKERPTGPPVPPKNVLIVLLDATSAKHLHDWGYPRDTAPNLRKLAREGTTFLNAHSQAANTTQSLWSFFTGRYPYIPGPGYTTHHPSADDVTMAEAFRASGFHTGAIVENPWLLGRYGWDKGFDSYKEVPALYDHIGNNWSRDPASTQRTIDRAKEWISAQADARWFCYVHLIRPHEPYDPPEPFASRYGKLHRSGSHSRSESEVRNAAKADPASISKDDIDFMKSRYDGNIRYADALVGEFMDWLDRKGLHENTLVVFMGDHGEAFMEHGVFGHNDTVYEEVTQVPLVILAPKSAGFARGTQTDPVGLIDVMPTFNDLFDLKAKTKFSGASLVPALRGQTAQAANPMLSISHSAHDFHRLSRLQGSMKFIGTTDPGWNRFVSYELYDLSKDPHETHDLAGNAELLAPFRAEAERYLYSAERRDASTDPELTSDDIEKLRSIGYVP